MDSLEDKRLGEEVIRRFKEAQKQLVVGGEKRSRTVHASHITGACMRKSWYEFREKPEPLSAESIANFYVGQLLHQLTPLAKKNEIKFSANIRTMKPIDVKDINDYNLFDCVTGTSDDLIEWEGDLVIVDKIKQLVEPDRLITKYCRYCPFRKICAPPAELIPPWS